ncbi:HNH endonuclease [Rubellimicrobium roseum]|uniref:HNH endonuclease n=1 Tax=Rubellimicrobium roseum TaxID=687525 RepID=A0A5C4NGB2_9RHOB|nr:HNH endonuclease [Rubellimicrobium roseum]TNC72428.1 HNH endonuclease [Rubellimicrobium roseum]
MVKAVFIQSRHAIYQDAPGERYHFPSRSYLSVAAQTVGDWVLFYEGRRGGGRGYYAVQKVERIVPDPTDPTHHFAILNPSTLLGFEQHVPYADPQGAPYESRLAGPDGRVQPGGLNTAAIRVIPERDFARIVDLGLAPRATPDALPRDQAAPAPPGPWPIGLHDPAVPFARAPGLADWARILTSRALRDESFARQVKVAYGARCAMSGLALRNGGGRPEVNAAHIRPVASQGPDTVQNGLALSGTLHWMFDRGLVSVAEDHSILVAQGAIRDEDRARLLTPDSRLALPADQMDWPHPAYLAWHRQNVFKG